jgi:DNA-binding transcriptional ArsR family regulator
MRVIMVVVVLLVIVPVMRLAGVPVLGSGPLRALLGGHWQDSVVIVATVGHLALYVPMYARDNAATASHMQQGLPSAAQIDAAVTALRMLADGTRLRLMWLLCDGEHDVSSLAATVGAARPAVSQHLAKLLLAGLVTTRRDGRRALYTARGGHVRRLVTEILQAADHHLSGEPDHD